MTIKHTPGPWEWDAGVIPPDGPGRYADIYIIAEDGEPTILAEFNDSLPEGRANAYLMTAGPEMFAALQFITDVARSTSGFSLMAIKQADAAIAKAKGAA